MDLKRDIGWNEFKKYLKYAILVGMFVGLIVNIVHVSASSYIYEFTWIHTGAGLTVTAYTDDPACTKISFRYWLGSTKHGDPDLENKNVPTSLKGGYRVSIDTQTDPQICEDWYIEAHFHSTSNVEGSVKVAEGVHVPWFTNLGLVMLAAIILNKAMGRKG